MVAGLGTATRTAHAQNGNWAWGSPGFTSGWSPAQRENYLVTNGLADPSVDYWTPFWQSGDQPNVYTGQPDVGYQNEYAVNHDINANFGIPVVGYLDIFTPLIGTNELEIGATIQSVWDGIVDSVSSTWDYVTDWFSSDYSSYIDTGTYFDGGWDNGFMDSYSGYDYSGGSCLVVGVPGEEPNYWTPIETCP